MEFAVFCLEPVVNSFLSVDNRLKTTSADDPESEEILVDSYPHLSVSDGFKLIYIFKHSIMKSKNDEKTKMFRCCKMFIESSLVATLWIPLKAKSSSTFQSKTSHFIYFLLKARM